MKCGGDWLGRCEMGGGDRLGRREMWGGIG